ncbi:MAG: radical SAM protein [Deltaproteobacteria bacterium]|nr:radical SAM protein [Deltaproteobacteria bacterium]
MRILFVYMVTENVNMPVLALGLGCVAAAAETDGHVVKVINVTPRDQELLKRTAREFQPDLAALSMRNLDDQVRENPAFLAAPVKDAVAWLRESSNAPVVLGGAGFTLAPEAAMAYTGADWGVAGAGESTFCALARALAAGKEPGPLPGLYGPQGILGTPPDRRSAPGEFPLPEPERHLPVLAPEAGGVLWVPVQSRRGCPMRCSYCSTGAIEGTALRKSPPERAIEMMRKFTQAGFFHFFFVDNTFNLPPSYAHVLCSALIEADLGASWRAIIYPKGPDAALAQAMARAGCVGVSLGFESGSPKILAAYNKKFSIKDIEASARALGDAGIGRMGFLLLGGPGETRETVVESLEFADRLDLEAMKITCGIRIYPHTKLAGIARLEGVVAPDDDLFFPRFYLAPGLNGWIQEKVAEYAATRPHWQV